MNGLITAIALLVAVAMVNVANAQTIVSRDYHAALAPEHCWIYGNKAGINESAIDPNKRGGILGDLASITIVAGPSLTTSLPGCVDTGVGFSCLNEDRTLITDPTLLPEVVKYCIRSTDRINAANNAAGHAKMFFHLSTEQEIYIRHALVRPTNQMDYYLGRLPSCSSLNHTGKSIVDGFIVCDKDKDQVGGPFYEALSGSQ